MADPHAHSPATLPDTWSAERWEEAIRAVFRRALTDAGFRARAIVDPRGAFAEANGGATAPENVRFRFAEHLEEHVYVLPKVAQLGEGLSEIDIARILHHSYRQQSIPPGGSM